MEDYDYHSHYRKESGLSEEMDELTRQRMKMIKDTDNSLGLAFILGIVVGIVLASFLHKFIVHPLGW